MVKVAAAVDKDAFNETVGIFTTFWIDPLKDPMPDIYDWMSGSGSVPVGYST